MRRRRVKAARRGRGPAWLVLVPAAALLVAPACGKKDGAARAEPEQARDSGAGSAAARDGANSGDPANGSAGANQADVATGPAALLPLGLPDPSAFDETHSAGRAAFEAARAAARHKDWADAAAACQRAVRADPHHLDAEYLWAVALLHLGRSQDAVDHLRVALAGDWLHFSQPVVADPELAPLRASPPGKELQDVMAADRAGLIERIQSGLLLVARRAPASMPRAGKGTRRVTSEAELYAYDRGTGRYLRLTHTGFSVVGFLAAPSGDQVAYVRLDRVTLPASGPPLLSRARVGVVHLADPGRAGHEVRVPRGRTLVLGFAQDGALVATAYQAEGTWQRGPGTSLRIDSARGRAVRVPAAANAPAHLVVRYEDVERIATRAPDGVAADWNPDTGAAEEFVIESSDKRIQVRGGKAARAAGMVWSPDHARLAFTTAADPCATDPAGRAATLYAVDAESGRMQRVFTSAAVLAPAFASPTVLAYQDGAGRVGLYDVAAGRPLGRLESPGGIGLAGLGALPPGPLCTAEPPGADAATPSDGTAP